MAKGNVTVEIFKDRLRLRWSFAGKRYCLYMGLPDNKLNRTAAESKARQIELDMATENFDPSLKKYKSEEQVARLSLTAVELFDRFKCQRGKGLYKRSLEKYDAVLRYLGEYFKGTSKNRKGKM